MSSGLFYDDLAGKNVRIFRRKGTSIAGIIVRTSKGCPTIGKLPLRLRNGDIFKIPVENIDHVERIEEASFQ